MESLNVAFFIGILCAIPLAILANLLTPKIQTYLANRAAAGATARAQQLRKRLDSVASAAANNIQPSELLIEAVVTSSLVGAIGAVAAGICFSAVTALAAIPSLSPTYVASLSLNVWPVLQTTGTVVSALTSLVVINILSRAKSRASDLRNSRGLEEELSALTQVNHEETQ